MATWPLSLPQDILINGYEEQVPNTLIRSSMSHGPAKVRRRTTAGVRMFGAQMLLTKAQVATLDGFIVSTTNGGADAFDWEHPRTGASVSFRFVPLDDTAVARYNAISDDLYRAQLKLEILP